MKRNYVAGCGVLLLTTSLLFGQTVFKDKDPKEYKGEITVWSFTDEPLYYAEKFNQIYPNIKVNFTQTSGGQNYITKVNSAIAANNAPDVFTAEISFLKQWIDTGAWANISAAPYNAGKLTGELIPYVVALGKDSKGLQRTLSIQATPGGVFYRRGLAKQYFGTDDPVKVGKMMSNMTDFLKLAATVKDKSANKVHLFASWKDLRWFPFNARKSAWIKNGALVIEPVILEYFDIAKSIKDNNLSANADPSDPSWYAVMADNSVISYILPTWGLHYELKPGAEPKVKNPAEYSGDWALTSGPQPYYWGGTWFGISSKTKNAELAWQFVKFLAFDQRFLSQYVVDKGDFVSNLKTIETVKANFKEPFLGGQNSYAYFADLAKDIDVSKVTKYDQHIEKMLLNAISLYVEGTATKDAAVAGFKDEVRNAFPDIVVK